MPNKQKYMKETPQKFRIKISDMETGDENYVLAPLPDQFGFTLSNNYTTPFDVGSLGGLLSKANAVTGKFSGGRSFSTAPGIGMDKVFTNPEPSEISFDLDFSAYYDPLNEVALPVLQLTKMTAANTVSYSEGIDALQALIERISSSISAITGTNVGDVNVRDHTSKNIDNYGSRAMQLINFMRGPGKVSVSFGEVFTISDAFVSSLGVEFSNKVDVRGIPLSAKCSVTIVLEHVPTNEIIANKWFSDIADKAGL